MSEKAKLCSSCSIKERGKCVICGNPIFGEGKIARICDSCGIGMKKDNCIICNRPTFGKGTNARICEQCAIEKPENMCVLCGNPIFR